jgi:hypothetical protein
VGLKQADQENLTVGEEELLKEDELDSPFEKVRSPKPKKKKVMSVVSE